VRRKFPGASCGTDTGEGSSSAVFPSAAGSAEKKAGSIYGMGKVSGRTAT
jgi:hypothetical protein